MSISNVTNPSDTQALARQFAAAVDSNKDGQVTVGEFGDFLQALLSGNKLTAASLTSAPSSTLAPKALGFTPMFQGFDASRAQSAAGSLKYDAYNVLQSYDPKDPAAMQAAFPTLNAQHPGMYELDAQDNLMLTGTADGYVGARPVNRDSDWTNRNQDWAWTWFGYNTAHPGPKGEIV
jgi:hypothetical protein